MIKNIPYKFRKNNFLKFIIVKVIISFIIILGLIMLFPHFVRSTYVVTIANKRIVRRDNTDTYLIYTQMEDGSLKVFKNTNSLLEFKINSEDVYWGLTINRKYEIRTYGFNLPLISSYKNIIKVYGIKIGAK